MKAARKTLLGVPRIARGCLMARLPEGQSRDRAQTFLHWELQDRSLFVHCKFSHDCPTNVITGVMVITLVFSWVFTVSLQEMPFSCVLVGCPSEAYFRRAISFLNRVSSLSQRNFQRISNLESFFFNTVMISLSSFPKSRDSITVNGTLKRSCNADRNVCHD